MVWFLITNIILSIICFNLIQWADFHLFTYLGEVEINGKWEQCFMYHTLTIPARIVTFAIPVGAMFICFACWGLFFDIMGPLF